MRDANWLGDEDLDNFPEEGLEVAAKVRSTRPPRPAILRYEQNRFSVELLEGETGVAPGQACVLYDGEGNDARVLGGGFITHSERAPQAEAMLKQLLENLNTISAA